MAEAVEEIAMLVMVLVVATEVRDEKSGMMWSG
jgi:hypothetical protein